MESKIIIDDDFTVNVREDADTAMMNIKEELFSDNEFDDGMIIKEEFSFDEERRYLSLDKYICLEEIKTEIKSESDEEAPSHIVSAVLKRSNSPEKSPKSEEDVPLPHCPKLELVKVEDVKLSEKRFTPGKSEENIRIRYQPNLELVKSEDVKISEPITRVKNEMKKLVKKPNPGFTRYTRKSRNRFKTSRKRRNYLGSRNDRFKTSPNIWNRFQYNTTEQNYNNDMQSYYVILQALYELLQQNRNQSQIPVWNNNLVPPFGQNGYKTSTSTPIECSLQLQTILQIINQASSRIYQNSVTYMNNCKLEMPFPNFFKPF